MSAFPTWVLNNFTKPFLIRRYNNGQQEIRTTNQSHYQ